MQNLQSKRGIRPTLRGCELGHGAGLRLGMDGVVADLPAALHVTS